jgi:hypothetical protein
MQTTSSAPAITFPDVTTTGYHTPITLNATASSGLPVTYFVSGPASVSGNQLTVTGPGAIKLLAYQEGARPAWHNAPLVQAVVMSIAEAWRLANFGSTSNTGARADLADFDNDGALNLFEFAFGTNTLSGITGLPGLLIDGGTLVSRGQPVVMPGPAAVFIRRKDHIAAGLTYTVQFSADLSAWESSTTTPTVLSDDVTHEAVSVPFPALVGGAVPRFFKVQISITP